MMTCLCFLHSHLAKKIFWHLSLNLQMILFEFLLLLIHNLRQIVCHLCTFDHDFQQCMPQFKRISSVIERFGPSLSSLFHTYMSFDICDESLHSKTRMWKCENQLLFIYCNFYMKCHSGNFFDCERLAHQLVMEPKKYTDRHICSFGNLQVTCFLWQLRSSFCQAFTGTLSRNHCDDYQQYGTEDQHIEMEKHIQGYCGRCWRGKE
jgi:hypothetical protein